MTHSYEEILQLDSQRTQGRWEAMYDDKTNSRGYDEECCIGIGVVGTYYPDVLDLNDNRIFIEGQASTDIEYIAAMPDAVGLLKLYKQLLDRAMQGLEAIKQHQSGLVKGNIKGTTWHIADKFIAEITEKLGDTNG